MRNEEYAVPISLIVFAVIFGMTIASLIESL